MRLIRYQTAAQPASYGWVLEDRVGLLEGDPFGIFYRHEAETSLEKVRLLPPVLPGKIICVGRNYAEHAREHNAEVPDVPLLFLKPPSSLLAPGGVILLPPQSQRVEHEAELAIVIGKRGRWITAERAAEYIFGYTIANDVTARDLQRRDGQWTRAKGFDTFCPVGPWVDTDFDPTDVPIICKINDEIRQMGATRDMVFGIPQLVAFASSVMTLDPGDLILTGTPAGVSQLLPGDRVQIEIGNLGILHNTVATDSSVFAA